MGAVDKDGALRGWNESGHVEKMRGEEVRRGAKKRGESGWERKEQSAAPRGGAARRSVVEVYVRNGAMST